MRRSVLRRIGIFLLVLVAGVMVVAAVQPQPVQAQEALDQSLPYATATGLSTRDIREIVARIIQVALGLLGLVGLLIVLYAAFLWLTSGGDEEKIGTAKAMLRNGLIGIVIILAAYSIVLFVFCQIFYFYGFCPALGARPRAAAAQPIGNPPFPSGAQYLVVTSRTPDENEDNVARNTKISVTFNENIDPKSIKVINPPVDEDGRVLDQSRLLDLLRGSLEFAADQERPAAQPTAFLAALNSASDNPAGQPQQCTDPSVQVFAWNSTENDFTTPVYGAVTVVGNALTFTAAYHCGDDSLYTPCTFEDGRPNCEPGFSNSGCCGCLLPANFDFSTGGVQLKVVLGRGIKAKNNDKRLARDTVWLFTVANRLETSQPKVVSILPPNNEDQDVKVPANTGIQVLFDKPIDPTTLIPPGTTVSASTGSIRDANFAGEAVTAPDDPAEVPVPPTVRIYQVAADGTRTLINGTIQTSVTGFVFRPSTACTGANAAGCQCFATNAQFQVELLGHLTDDGQGNRLDQAGIRDSHCNELDCSNGLCQSQFFTSDVIDTTPPTITVSSGDQSLGENHPFRLIARGKPLQNPLDDNDVAVNADRTAKVYASFCDRTRGMDDAECSGYINSLSINNDTLIVSGLSGIISNNLPTDLPRAECCFPGGSKFGNSCALDQRTLCPSTNVATLDYLRTHPTDPSGLGPFNQQYRQASANVVFAPRTILEAFRRYQATAYGGGSVNGSCAVDATHWGIEDLAGNSLIMQRGGEVLPNADWFFTTGDAINYGNPYISGIAPATGHREQCITVLGGNFSEVSSGFFASNPTTSAVPIPPSSQVSSSRCTAVEASTSGCTGKVFFRSKTTGEIHTTDKLYAWHDDHIVAVVPDALQLDRPLCTLSAGASCTTTGGCPCLIDGQNVCTVPQGTAENPEKQCVAARCTLPAGATCASAGGCDCRLGGQHACVVAQGNATCSPVDDIRTKYDVLVQLSW